MFRVGYIAAPPTIGSADIIVARAAKPENPVSRTATANALTLKYRMISLLQATSSQWRGFGRRRASPACTGEDRNRFHDSRKIPAPLRATGLCRLNFAKEAKKPGCEDRVATLTQTDNGELVLLIDAVAAGDRDAFGKLYQRTAPKLFAILLRILRNRGAAEDALQDVFLKIWQNAGSFSAAAGPPMGWLISVARNRAIDILRRKNPAEPAATETADIFANIADTASGEEQMTELAALQHCLETLDEQARACILLAYYEGYSREELANRFGRPVGTVKTWLHRSLALLKSCLEATT
jgi:RNA polymerase sigma factor (sigma-70 family)